MPSSLFVLSTIISLLLTRNLCSADPPGPSGATGPKLPNPPGYDCAFAPPSGCGPDTTTPAYNDCLVRDHSVTEFIQCANQTSTISSDDDDQQPLNALDVLVSAIKIPACSKCKARTVLADYQSVKSKGVKLAKYLCGKVGDGDVCCFSNCIGAKESEHSLKGICTNDEVNLWDNDGLDCGGDSDDGEGGGGGGNSDADNDQTAASSSATTSSSATASSSATISNASKPTATPSTSSNIAPQTTSPTQTATSSPAGSSSSSAGSRIRAANIIASGLLVAILTAGIGAAV